MVVEAIEHYNKALKPKPNFSRARYNLAAALVKQGKTDEAIKGYHESLQLGPGNVDEMNSLGFALAEQGKIDEAIKEYRQALQINPDYTKARQALRALLKKAKWRYQIRKQIRID